MYFNTLLCSHLNNWLTTTSNSHQPRLYKWLQYLGACRSFLLQGVQQTFPLAVSIICSNHCFSRGVVHVNTKMKPTASILELIDKFFNTEVI